MKEELERLMSVRKQGNIVDTLTVKQVILEPEGIHLDDIVYALQQVVAGIIRQEENKNE